MIPHERSLVKRFAGQPFALLGVSSDDDRDKLRDFLRSQDITWPVWWDHGTGGAIAKRWNVRSYPTVYILDSSGTIRFKNVYGKALQQAAHDLLEEAQTSSGSGQG